MSDFNHIPDEQPLEVRIVERLDEHEVLTQVLQQKWKIKQIMLKRYLVVPKGKSNPHECISYSYEWRDVPVYVEE